MWAAPRWNTGRVWQMLQVPHTHVLALSRICLVGVQPGLWQPLLAAHCVCEQLFEAARVAALLHGRAMLEQTAR